MVITLIPPLWTDRDDCFRCHTTFSAFTRKHHCRACGETFCSACSSKQCPLPEYGIDEEVRVCITCYDRIKATGSIRPQYIKINKPNEPTQNELEDEDALQLALTLSRNEAEEKERQKKLLTQKYVNSTPSQYAEVPIGSAPVADETYWETQTRNDLITIKPLSNDPADQFIRDDDIDIFVNTVNEHINNIKFRMLSNQQRGRNIANDTAVQSVFLTLQHMHPELHRLMKLLDDKQAYYEGLQDKLNQLKDAREALNSLREENLENKRRHALERERQRQLQLAVKLDDMRQKKQAYLEYQRQLHLQHLNQQEAEMQARLNQQKQYVQLREQQNQLTFIPTAPGNYYQPATTAPPLSMSQLSNALPSLVPAPQAQYIYAQQQPSAPTIPPSKDQKLISID